jgi:hypothetical protein
MTNPAEASHAPDHAAAGTLPYTAEEWQAFRDWDKNAAGHIVGLMTSIFTVGLVLYLIVLWSVAG